jgi:hypothetical protein
MSSIDPDTGLIHDPSEISDSDSFGNEVEENRNQAYNSNFDVFGSPSEMINAIPDTLEKK